MSKVKVCLIGCGRVALSHIGGAAQTQAVEIIAVVDMDLQRAKNYEQTYQIPFSFASVEEAVQNVSFDAVDICLPNHLHKDMALRCIALHKHVLLEKPMANSWEDCVEMADAAKAADVRLMVGQSRRYYPAVLQSKPLAGKVLSISAELFGYLVAPPTAWWRSAKQTGGLMIPLWGNHIFDYILWMMEEMPESVYCLCQNLNPAWEGEDEVAAIFGFSGGRYANIRMSWNMRLNDEAWNGEGKMLSSRDIRYARYILAENGSLLLEDETTLFHNGKLVVEDHEEVSNFCREYEEFAACICENREPLTNALVGMQNVAIQKACLDSAAQGRIVHREENGRYV